MHPSTSITELVFRKSSYSANASDCVEVAETKNAYAVRDTKNREAGHLAFAHGEWSAALLAAVRTTG
ncbi:DUF397 domain-containing protein [Nocardiopsis prasina]|uniref:DUF397 domain-containing protein n=1 Tax=Nocardiopsis prasina TaxID=2015 RepID=UPI000A045589|nr:DUF397 domain-containing protein [Nocardiopsis prasina]